MKVDEKLLKNIMILIIVSFLIIPFLFSIFGLDKKVYETFEGYDKTADDVCMNVFTYGKWDDAKFAYCINGDISCGSNSEIHDIGSTHDRYKLHFNSDNPNPNGLNMYRCRKNDGTRKDITEGVKCLNSAFTNGNTSGGNLTLFKYDTNGDRTNDILTIEQDVSQNGFTKDYATESDFPLSFEGNYAISNDISYSLCGLFEKEADCYNKRNPSTDSGESAGSGESNGTVDSGNVEKTSFRCVADYGAQPGDDLCCGQTGVVQNNSDTCPHEYPKCYGYECGKKWGVCKSS